jgi:hypothetical protein
MAVVSQHTEHRIDENVESSLRGRRLVLHTDQSRTRKIDTNGQAGTVIRDSTQFTERKVTSSTVSPDSGSA